MEDETLRMLKKWRSHPREASERLSHGIVKNGFELSLLASSKSDTKMTPETMASCNDPKNGIDLIILASIPGVNLNSASHTYPI